MEEGLGVLDRRRQPIEDLRGEDFEADDLETNLDTTPMPAEARRAAEMRDDPVSSVSSETCLLSSLRESPPMEA